MKIRLILFVIALCGAFATTAAFGQGTGNSTQTNFVWIAAGSNIDVGTSTNWTPTGVPNPARNGASSNYGDIMDFDGQTAGPVFAASNGGAQVGASVGGTTAGIYLHLTSNQVNRVTLYTTLANSASQGVRFNSIAIDAGAGGFTMGTGSTTNSLDTLWGTTNPQTQGLTNNSANPAIINKDVRWRLGAGGAHTFVFSGTGDWYVTNDIANVNGAATVIQKDGPGTMYWTAGNNGFWGTETVIASPLAISGGTLMLLSSGLFPPNTTINMSSNAAASVLEFNVVGGSQTIANPVNGNGSVQVNNGTLTLGGAGTYTGNTILSGGKLVANRAENVGANGPLGVGGTISFSGGTLAYTVLNNADYSARFSTNDNQAYRIDTSGDGSANNVTFSNALTSKGGTLTKLGSGTLTLAGTNTYSGLTTISAGELLFQGPMSGSTNIIVADGATLGVFGNGAQQLRLATLTMGSASGANLEFDNVSSLTTTPLVVGTISATGPITINIGSGSFDTIGQVFPLLTWSNGSAPTIVLGTVNGANGNLVTNGNTLALKVTATAYIYTGLNGGVWDLATPNNWKQSGSAVLFANGAPTLIDDSAATGTPYVSIYDVVSPSVFSVNNNVINYTIFAGLGPNWGISGGTGLTKSGNAPLAIYGPNAYTGVTTLNGGVTSVDTLDNGGAPTSIGAASSSATNLVLNGGTLQYIGNGASIDRSFTLGPSGGAIDSSGAGALNLINTGAVGLSGAGSHTLVLTGVDPNDDLFALSLTDSVAGATALTKAGLGTWVLTGTNKYSGVTAIQGGTLQFGNGGATGSIGSGNVTDNGRLIFNRTGSNVIAGVVSGTGSVRVGGGGTVVLPGNNSYSGGTTISNGSTLQVGNRGATGSLNASGAIVDNGLLIFNTTGTFNLTAGGINGTGNLIVRGGGLLASISGNTFTGWTVIDPGSTFMPCEGLQGSLYSSVVTNNGTLMLIRQDGDAFVYSNTITGSGRVLVDANNVNAGDVTLAGNCNYTGGTFIGDNGLKVGTDTNGIGNGWITGNVTFTNSARVPYDNPRTLTFNRPDNVTFPGNIVTNFASPQVNLGILVQNGTGVLTLTGTNTYGSGTTITNGGTLQVGNGGTSGSIGSGPVTDNGVLIFNRADDVTLARAITGTGSLIKTGAGKLTLSNTNDIYAGDTTVSNGTLVTAIVSGNLNVNGGTVVTTNVVGNVNVNSGTLATAAGSSVGALTAFNNLNISGGTVQVSLDKTRSDITSYLFVISAVNYTNGTLKLINVGPALTVGDTFQISYLPVVRGNAMPIVSPGFTVTNHLGDDGTVVVTGVTASVAKVTTTVSGGQLTLSWPSAWTGLNLQVQTNTLAKGLGTNWVTIPGYDTVNGYTNTIDKTSGSVFYRLAP